MIHEKITITSNGEEAYAYTYLLTNIPEVDEALLRPLIIICPGGGYEHTSNRESEPIAIQLNAAGFHAIILRYSVSPARFPTALLQLAQLVEISRSNAQKWKIDPNKILVAGFSAGGHLAASLGVLWDKDILEKSLGGSKEQYRPNALILSYPVITSGEYAHQGSMDNLFGNDKDLCAAYSLENLVSKTTPPTFLWHTVEDDAVPVENAMLFASALRKNGIGFELHLYQYGVHGLSLGTAETGNPDTYGNVPTWISLVVEWIKNLL